MVSPVPSYLVLEPGRPVKVRVKDWRQEDRTITDPATKQPKSVNILVLSVSEVDGQPRETTLSFTSFKAQQLLAPLLNSGLVRSRVLEVVRRPAGYATEYEFRLL